MKVQLTEGSPVLSVKAVQVTVLLGKKVLIQSQSSQEIDWPGEYEVSGVTVRSFAVKNNLAFLLALDGVRIFFPPQNSLESAEEELKKIGNIEVVYVAGDSSSWSAKDWKKFLEEVDCPLVLFGEGGEKTKAIQKEMSISDIEGNSEITISYNSLPSDKTKYVSLVS